MAKSIRLLTLALLSAVALLGSGQAASITVPIESTNSGAWLRSDGGSGTTMPAGAPAIWNARSLVSIPPGAINISFTLNTFSADDKGVVELYGGIAADAVIQLANGAAAGAGTFDFGKGGGNQPYVFQGFAPGSTFVLPDGTTDPALIVYINDTGTTNPSAPPLSEVYISDFSLSGSLTYDFPPAPVPTLSQWAMMILIALLAGAGVIQARRRRH